MSSSLIIKGKSAEVLSKLQKQFNNYVKRIQTLKTEIDETQKQLDLAQVRIHKEIAPLEKQVMDLEVEVVKMFDEQYNNDYFKKAEKKKIADFILQKAFQLIERGHEDLKEIYEKYSDGKSFDEQDQEAEAATADQMKRMMSMMFGIDFEDDADVSTPEKMQAYMDSKMNQNQAEQEARRANRKRSDKQIEKEEKARQELKNISKAARAIYTDLVKAFHPDLEQDEAEKERKTKIMHRITEAYEKDDLFELLRLKIELQGENIDAMTLADEQLKYYNKILKEQVSELDNQLFEMQGGMSLGFGSSLYHSFCGTPKAMDSKFKRLKTELKKRIEDMKDEIELLRMPDIMRDFLKNRGKRTPKRISFEDMF